MPYASSKSKYRTRREALVHRHLRRYPVATELSTKETKKGAKKRSFGHFVFLIKGEMRG